MNVAFRADGEFDLSYPAGRLTGLTAAVQVTRGVSRRWALSRGVHWVPGADGVGHEAALPDGMVLRLRADPVGGMDFAVLRLTLVNGSAAAVVVHRLFPLVFGGGAWLELRRSGGGVVPWGVYKQGYQSWSYCGWRPLNGRDISPRSPLTRGAHADPTWPPPMESGRFQSDGMLMVGRPGPDPVLLAGFTGGARQLGRLELRAGAPMTGLEAWCEADGVRLNPGDSLAAEPLMVAMAPEREALAAYAAACGREMGTRVAARSPAVWCSWYYHFTAVRPEHVITAAAALADRQMSHPVDVIQLDDGYQAAVGDWLVMNRKFRHGLAWLAKQIRDAGFKPGLWVAPFIAQRRSRLFREHPDWFVQTPAKDPARCGWNPGWVDLIYGLDTTNPAVQAWLTALTHTLVDAGFAYLKLDFLYGAAVAGQRHDPAATRASALRTGLEVIRQAAGDEVFILGCGTPMLPAVGVVDAMRVGPDVAPNWRFNFFGLPILGAEPGVAAARNAVRGALNRQWMHGRLWANDPDSLILRERSTQLTPAEAQSLVSIGGLTGGVVSFSDQPGTLSPERLEWLRRSLPVAGLPGVQPVTLLAEEFPFLSTAHHGEWLMVLAFNEGDRARPLTLAFADLGLAGACHAYDSWADTYLGTFAGTLDAGVVPPHGSRVLALLPVRLEPQVVGSAFHLSPAAVVSGVAVATDGTLEVKLTTSTRGRGAVTIAMPQGTEVVQVICEGAVLLERRAGAHGSLVVHLESISGGGMVRLAFRQVR